MKTLFRLLFLSLLTTVSFVAVASEQQIHIKARFLEVPEETLATLRGISPVMSDGTEILSRAQMAKTLQEFKLDSNVKILAEPEVTTTSGRQTQMRATTIQTVIDDIDRNALASNSVVFLQKKIECGPVFDVIPTAHGSTIQLKFSASVTRFLGYGKSANTATVYSEDKKQSVQQPIPSPMIQREQMAASVNVPDGQTVLLEAKSSSEGKQDSGTQKKFLIVMITSEFVDESGNRIHSDN
jgi:Flp pilus assembly secretin CpaC